MKLYIELMEKKNKKSNHRNCQSKITLHSHTYCPYSLTDNHFASTVLTLLFFFNCKNGIKSIIPNKSKISAFANNSKMTIEVAISTFDSLYKNHLHSLVKINKGLKTFFPFYVKMDKLEKKFYYSIVKICRTQRKFSYRYVKSYDILKKSFFGIVKTKEDSKKSLMSDFKMYMECTKSIHRCSTVFYSSLIYYRGKEFSRVIFLFINFLISLLCN